MCLLLCLVGFIVHRKSQRQMNERMNKQLEMLESNIRRDIRQGWSSLKCWSLWCLQVSLLLILKVSVTNTKLNHATITFLSNMLGSQ